MYIFRNRLYFHFFMNLVKNKIVRFNQMVRFSTKWQIFNQMVCYFNQTVMHPTF